METAMTQNEYDAGAVLVRFIVLFAPVPVTFRYFLFDQQHIPAALFENMTQKTNTEEALR